MTLWELIDTVWTGIDMAMTAYKGLDWLSG